MRFRIILGATLALVIGTAARAATITATYDFTGSSGGQISEAVDSVVGTGAAFGAITRGSGLTASNAGNSISSSGFTTGSSRDANDYYQVVINPEAGSVYSLLGLAFSERRSSTGIREIEVLGSLDGFTSSTLLKAVSVADNTFTRRHSIDLSGFGAFQGVTTAITLRIFGFAAEGAAGTWRLGATSPGFSDNPNSLPGTLVVSGGSQLVSVVPEPASVLMLAGGFAGLSLAALRRRVRAS